MIRTMLFLRMPQAAADPFAARGEAALRRLRDAGIPAQAYTQSRALSQQIEGREPMAFAGVAECLFADVADARALAEQPARLAPLLAPGATIFAVVTGSDYIVMRAPAHTTTPGIKGVFPFRRRADLDRSAFAAHWRYRHGPIAALTESALCYRQCHIVLQSWSDGALPPFDAVTELFWPDVASARASMASRQMREDQGADARNFVDPESVLLVLAEEEVVLAP
jgi:uncharacterized protein (TIGR02118 family)